MIILHSTEKLQITVTEENLFANKKDFQIIFSNRTYVDESGKWRCVSDSEQRPLYAHLRGEYAEGKIIADAEFDRMHWMFNQNVAPTVIDITGTPEPIITPQPQKAQSDLGQMLQESLLKVLAEQSKKDKVLKDYFVGDVQIKNVPFIENSSSYTDPYVLSGKTLDRICSLILENEATGRKSKVIFYK